MATRPFSADDRWLFNSGEHENLYEVLGAQIGPESVTFRVWAPNAEAISVMGDFNSWDPAAHPMVGSESGVWETTVPGAEKGTIYKYAITPRGGGRLLEKADPFAFHAENPPKSGSIVWDLDYQWEDAGWMAARAAKNGLDAPISVYECHLGSWSRQGPMDYVSLAKGLVEQNPKQVAQYRAGKTQMLGFFVGQIMKATSGSANPALVNDILKRLLEPAS